MDDTLRFTAPSSKSLTQRALILAALSQGESELAHPLDSDDTRHLSAALQALGVGVDKQASLWRVSGGRLRAPSAPLFCGDGGTVSRFLAPLAVLVEGEIVLDGSDRLAERPHSGLFEALAQLGVAARLTAPPRGLPVGLRRAGTVSRLVRVDASSSSQFVSGLAMIAPLLPGGLSLEIIGSVSRPYVEMTLPEMRVRGVQATLEGQLCRVEPGEYRHGRFHIEGDWSGAAFLLAAGFVTRRQVVVENVRLESCQGDRAIAAFVSELGLPRAHRFDLEACPDLLPPLAAAAVFASHPSEIVGVAHARVKESDRVATLSRGFTEAGIVVQERADGLVISPSTPHPARLDPVGDHRMAMAFGLLSLREPGVQVSDPACVSKSYPRFWEELERFRR